MSKSKAGQGTAKAHKGSLVAMHEADAHNATLLSSDALPPLAEGGHSHSSAAHLNIDGGEPHTKPQGNLRQGSNPGALREPPMIQQRIGKQRRGQ